MYFTRTYHFQNSEESHYNLFVDRLANKRRQSAGQPEPRPATERSPSIVLGAGKPIVPPSVNPLVSLEVQIVSFINYKLCICYYIVDAIGYI